MKTLTNSQKIIRDSILLVLWIMLTYKLGEYFGLIFYSDDVKFWTSLYGGQLDRSYFIEGIGIEIFAILAFVVLYMIIATYKERILNN